jgi:glycopeptide antibiotics resistance protein
MNKRIFRVFCTVCFIVYLALLVKLIVFKYPGAMTREVLRGWSVGGLIRHIQSANLIPFKTISRSLSSNRLRVEITALIYNVIAFSPLGFLLPCLGERTRRWGVVLIAGLGVSLAIELVQVVTMLGAADIDDVILNVIGTMIGYGLFRLVSAAYRRIYKPSGAAGGDAGGA